MTGPDSPERTRDVGDRDVVRELGELSPGSRVGPYVILEQLGHGGMGEVFLGNDPRLRRRVALKRLTAFTANSAEERSQILNEARAAARITHPNVATVHDVLEHDSHAFIVMEYVVGESLAVHLRRERLPVNRIIGIGRQLASALVAAHANGIIHRDLKPANIQLTPDGTVKVLDFGVAVVSAAVTVTTASSGNQMRTPGPAGTPGYMAPEQMLGRGVDERSDIFSLGVVLFEMTTGHRPYGRGNLLDMIDASGEPVPRADAVTAGVPRALADLIAKATEIEPRERFQSALDLGAALEALQRELEIPIRPRDAESTGGETATIRPIGQMAAVIVLIPVLLAIFGLISTQAFNITTQRSMPFASEPWYVYPLFGLMSIVAPVSYMAAAAIVFAALMFVVRVLSVVPSVSRPLTEIRTRTGRVMTSIGLDDPLVLAQGVAALAVFALAAVLWGYRDLINAWSSTISIAESEVLRPLSLDNRAQQSIYGVVLDVLILAFGVIMFRLLKLRERRRVRGGLGSVALVFAILAVFVFLWEAPYRILFQNKRERIAVAENRCYVLGEHEQEWLVFCPDVDPPRNRIIRSSDPSVRKLGIVESIFTPAKTARPVS